MAKLISKSSLLKLKKKLEQPIFLKITPLTKTWIYRLSSLFWIEYLLFYSHFKLQVKDFAPTPVKIVWSFSTATYDICWQNFFLVFRPQILGSWLCLKNISSMKDKYNWHVSAFTWHPWQLLIQLGQDCKEAIAFQNHQNS